MPISICSCFSFVVRILLHACMYLVLCREAVTPVTDHVASGPLSCGFPATQAATCDNKLIRKKHNGCLVTPGHAVMKPLSPLPRLCIHCFVDGIIL